MTTGQAAGHLVNKRLCEEDDDIDNLTVLSKAIRLLKNKLPAKAINNIEAEVRQSLEAIAVLLDAKHQQLDDDVLAQDFERTTPWMEKIEQQMEDQRNQTAHLEKFLKTQVSNAVKDLTTTIQNMANNLRDKIETTTDTRNQARPNSEPEPPNHEQATTYAQMVARQLTQPQHEQWILKGKTTEKQLIVRKPRDNAPNPLHTLNEEELVQKAALAIDLMAIAASDKPSDLKFIGARKLSGGDVVLDLNNNNSARWLKQTEVLKCFNEHFSGTSKVMARTFPLILQFVPIFADITTEDELRQIEAINELPPNSLQEGRWLKNPTKRKPNQTYAHAQVGSTDIDTANKIIREGITIHGKHVNAKKPDMEIPRCTKCQQRTWHKAQDCKAETDICARCAEEHRTETCTVSNTTAFRCAVCKRTGHGAASNECPDYQEKLNKVKSRANNHRYIFYPAEHPWTWVTNDEPPIYVTANELHNKQNRWAGMVTNHNYPPRHQRSHDQDQQGTRGQNEPTPGPSKRGPTQKTLPGMFQTPQHDREDIDNTQTGTPNEDDTGQGTGDRDEATVTLEYTNE